MRRLKTIAFPLLFLLVVSTGFIVLKDHFQGIVKRFQPTPVHSILRDSNSTQPANGVQNKTMKISETLDTAFNERQALRKALIKQFCEHRSHHNQSINFRALFVCPRAKILYCLTPKCASRHFRTILHNPHSLHDKQRLPPEEQMTAFETYFKFTFVREPFERLLSAYKDKFLYPKKNEWYFLKRHGPAILRAFRPNATRHAVKNLDDISFPEFIQYVRKESNKTSDLIDWHWDNYNNLCYMCNIEYDFIGHYETFEEDLVALEKMVRSRSDFNNSIAFGKYRVSKTSSELLKYYSQIPLKWINDLGVIYKSTFEMFNYSFPGPLEPLFQPSRLKGVS